MKLVALATSVLLLAISGCSANTDDAHGGGTEETVGESGETALAANANFGYFVVTRRDTHECLSPSCGGYFVKRVNQAKTTCGDGSRQAECYVSAISLASAGLSLREESEFHESLEAGQGLVRARMYKQHWNGHTLGTLKATEAWVGATGGTPNGTFYRAYDNAIRCIQAPCPSTSADELNGNGSHDLIDVVLTQTPSLAPNEALAVAQEAVGTRQGMLLAGAIQLPKCTAGTNCGPTAIASEFYVQVKPREGKTCGGRSMGACNLTQYCAWDAKDLCGRADAPGRCAYQPHFCTTALSPVCGCDGQTYSNSCIASWLGTSVSRTGACASNP